jgi:hypothetical protein
METFKSEAARWQGAAQRGKRCLRVKNPYARRAFLPGGGLRGILPE